MTSFESFYVLDGDLIIVKALLTGPRSSAQARLVLDTGAAMTTVLPEFAERIGYSARDGIRRTRVHTAIGAEDGYTLQVTELSVLGVTMPSFTVHVFDLGHDDIDGLLGMNFFSELDRIELRPAQQRILVEKLGAPAAQ